MSVAHARRRSAFAHAYAVILAGGSGTRFWPLSRRRMPKQLLQLFGQESLLEQAVARIRRAVPAERIFIFTSQEIHAEVARRLRGIPPSQIVAEPAQRNTAPTIALAAHEVLRCDPEGVMIILPADQLIGRPDEFLKVIEAGCEWASTEGRSVVLGIKPTRPETGFGYLKIGPPSGIAAGRKCFRVERFTEKPTFRKARKYLTSGRYLWNAGMFVWRASTLLLNLKRFQPSMARQCEKMAAAGGIRNPKALKRLFPRLEKISIDYALMERIPDIHAVAANICWSDAGSWSVAYDLKKKSKHGNVMPTKSLALASRGNLIISPRKLVVTVGAEDLIVVETEDALLVCAKDQSQNVGKAVQELVRKGWSRFL